MTIHPIRISGGMMMLPAREGTCPMCAYPHEPHLPHNQQSLFYQMRFYAEHGRWPCWEDAMAHCEETMRAAWRKALIDKGVDPQDARGGRGGRQA